MAELAATFVFQILTFAQKKRGVLDERPREQNLAYGASKLWGIKMMCTY